MQDNSFANFDLDQSIINELFNSQAKRISAQNKTMNIFKKWCRIEIVYGKLELIAAPHFCLVLSNPSDERKHPLTLVDSAKNINLWISVIGKHVKIHDVFVISEHFQKRSDTPIECLSLMVKWENVSVIETTLPQEMLKSKKRPLQNYDSHQNQSDTVAKDSDSQLKLIRIVVHHVSTPFYVDGDNSIAYCLVLISYFNRESCESKLWLVLTRQQVAWREFLVQNREYRIQFPPNTNYNYFDEHLMPLNNLFPPGSKTLREIFHHPDLFLTLNASTLPQNSKLYLSSKMNFAVNAFRLFKDSMSLWYSVAEAAQADVDLVSLYGQIDELLYTDDLAFGPGSCHLCNRGSRQEPGLKEPQWKDHLWVNPWQTKRVDNFPNIELPNVEDDMSTMKTGVPGNMVQVVKLRDTVTGDQVSLYMKHSALRCSQQVCRLLPGLVVCVTHLNRRMSNSGRHYYIATVLSNLRVLALPEVASGSETTSENWGRYGIWHQSPGSNEKMWGVLESFHLSKISISAKCKSCESLLHKGVCSAVCPNPGAYVTSAHAISKVQVISDTGSISMEKVLIKDDFVRKLLSIPEDIWAAALVAASIEEIVVFNDSAPIDDKFPVGLTGLFKIYCTMTHIPNQMYICLRRLSSKDGEDALYFCLQLESMNSSRLATVAQIARQASDSR